jgi:hypothetical protein
MTKQVQFRRGTSLQHLTFTGAEGEITVDTDKKIVVVHDGIKSGGYGAASRSDVIALSVAMGW